MKLFVTNDGVYIPAGALNAIKRDGDDAILIKEDGARLRIKSVNSEKHDHHKMVRTDGRVRIPPAWFDGILAFQMTTDRRKHEVVLERAK